MNLQWVLHKFKYILRMMYFGDNLDLILLVMFRSAFTQVLQNITSCSLT